MLIIGLIGSLSRGKHLIADILHKQYDFVILEYKDFKKKKDDVTKECLSKAEKTWPKNVTIIGINSLKVMNEMNDNPQFFPVAIEGPLILRFQRQKLRYFCSSFNDYTEFHQLILCNFLFILRSTSTVEYYYVCVLNEMSVYMGMCQLVTFFFFLFL